MGASLPFEMGAQTLVLANHMCDKSFKQPTGEGQGPKHGAVDVKFTIDGYEVTAKLNYTFEDTSPIPRSFSSYITCSRQNHLKGTSLDFTRLDLAKSKSEVKKLDPQQLQRAPEETWYTGLKESSKKWKVGEAKHDLSELWDIDAHFR
eukprot:GHVU01231507.1.p2 GENE.GHVU01231507.1~~GHVU01231507.1.p2  ORF type:complete len:148 (+),score=19.18 GHVU01231507.1:179-622(+)